MGEQEAPRDSKTPRKKITFWFSGEKGSKFSSTGVHVPQVFFYFP